MEEEVLRTFLFPSFLPSSSTSPPLPFEPIPSLSSTHSHSICLTSSLRFHTSVPTQHTRSLGLAVLRGPTIVLLSPVDGSEGELSFLSLSVSPTLPSSRSFGFTDLFPRWWCCLQRSRTLSLRPRHKRIGSTRGGRVRRGRKASLDQMLHLHAISFLVPSSRWLASKRGCVVVSSQKSSRCWRWFCLEKADSRRRDPTALRFLLLRPPFRCPTPTSKDPTYSLRFPEQCRRTLVDQRSSRRP